MIGTGPGTNQILVKPANSIYQLLSTNGDGSGSVSMNVDGSSTSVKFYIQPPVTEKYILKRMNVEVIDGNFNNANLYGTITLGNGMDIYVENDSGVIKRYTNEFKIKRTHDWALLAGVDSVTIGAATSDPLLVRWTFERGCSDIILDGSNTERLVVEVQDLMTGLDDQLIMVQGCKFVL